MTVKVLFVCLGNICRSPTAHGVFQKLGTGDWHIGRGPDERTQRAAQSRGYDLSSLRARQVTSADFGDFDYVLAMDKSNLKDLRAMAGDKTNCHVSLFLDFAESSWKMAREACLRQSAPPESLVSEYNAERRPRWF